MFQYNIHIFKVLSCSANQLNNTKHVQEKKKNNTEGKHSNMEVREVMSVLPIHKLMLQVEQESQEEF